MNKENYLSVSDREFRITIVIGGLDLDRSGHDSLSTPFRTRTHQEMVAPGGVSRYVRKHEIERLVRELAQALQIAVQHPAVPLDDVATHDDRIDVPGVRAEDNCTYRIRNRREVNVGR